MPSWFHFTLRSSPFINAPPQGTTIPVHASRHGTRGGLPSGHEDQDLLRLPDLVRSATQYTCLSGLSRLSRRAAGVEPGCRGTGHPGWSGYRLRGARRECVRAEKLLLSRPAEGLSDLAVRSATLYRRAPGRCAHTAHSHGGRRREVDARCCRLARRDRKSTRLNSSHTVISYAVFCLKKKKN